MTGREEDSGIDPSQRHINKVAELLEHIDEVAFEQAMQDPDGMMPANLVRGHIAKLREEHEREVLELGSRLSFFENLDYTEGRLRELHDKLEELLKKQTGVTSELLGLVANLGTTLSSVDR